MELEFFCASAAYAAPEAPCFCLVGDGFRAVFFPSRGSVPNIFILLRKNIERILLKFVEGNHYYE